MKQPDLFASEDAWRRATGERLREARNARKLYLKDVVALNPDEWSISRLAGYEQGIRSMSVFVGHQLAQKLGVSTAWLLGVDSTLGFKADELDLLARYRRSPEEARKLVHQMLALHSP